MILGSHFGAFEDIELRSRRWRRVHPFWGWLGRSGVFWIIRELTSNLLLQA